MQDMFQRTLFQQVCHLKKDELTSVIHDDHKD